MNFSSLSIKTRIAATMALLAFSMLVVGVLGLNGMGGIVDDLADMYERRVRGVGTLGDLQAAELDRQALITLNVLADDAEHLKAIRAERLEIESRAAALLKTYTEQQQSEEGQKAAHDIADAHRTYQALINEVDAAIAANDDDLAGQVLRAERPAGLIDQIEGRGWEEDRQG